MRRKKKARRCGNTDDKRRENEIVFIITGRSEKVNGS